MIHAATVSVRLDEPGTVVSPNLFGIFFEEISMAGDGGIYAELIRNRSFEDSSSNPDFWSLVTTGTAAGQMTLNTFAPMSGSNPQSLALTMTGGSGTVGAANSGYFGIPVSSGATYNLTFYARGSNGFSGPVWIRLESSDGNSVYAQANVAGLSGSWQRFAVPLVANATDANARLLLRITQPGTVHLDFVSLFPAQTFNNRTNGLRPDLMNMLVNLEPSFMRFPGGSWVNGQNLANAYHWKLTVGDPADRIPRWNLWGYMVDNGLGYHEYLQMSEDLGAEPLFCLNAGMAGSEVVPPSELGPWVQEALDAIEYANGSTDTFYGAMRVANGHPEPFNLRYIQIGNENGGAAYAANYAVFYDAIKSNYPAMNIIADVWGGIPNTRPVEIMDEHYYASASTFISYATKYDSYSRTGPKVFVGEYAVAYTIGPGFPANLRNALGEAAFMTGMERNSDIVVMSCYAPLFANLNHQSWTPDLIYFTGTQVYGTPSYYVQQMFYQNPGDYVLPTVVTVPDLVTNPPPRGAIGLGSWRTAVEYTNVVVTSNGVTLFQSDFANQGATGWNVYRGNWSVANGLYRQTSASTDDCRSTTGETNWANYTLSLRARKTGGSEGFLILFNWLDDHNWTWLNLGGWNNAQHGLEHNSNGTKSILGSRVNGSIQTGVWYDIRIELNGSTIQCYLDDTLILAATYPETAASGLYASSTFDRETGQVIIKAVNPYGQPLPTTFDFAGVDSVSQNGTLVRLTSGSSADENSLAEPTKVFPVTNSVSTAGTNFSLTLPANSLSVFRLTPAGINSYTNLLLQVPTPLNAGQSVRAAVWGQKSGNWIELTSNPNYAITYASLDTNVARVDVHGNVTAVGAGSAGIAAMYGALELSATQMVEVVAVPTKLAHRYSFSETSGSEVADSIGGPDWNGTLPNGGTFGGGQLTLSASGQQYVNLPAGILSNYARVTIEAWVTFPNQLPANCFFFGFGNTSGGTGDSYIFCAPRAGRVAITPGNWTGEQNAFTGVDFSFRTNLHLTSVFNPPAGYVAVYTNGVLAAINHSISVPLSAVDNVFSYIGRSLYSADPYPDFTLDEFRIYDGALTPGDIEASEALGPSQPVTFSRPTIEESGSEGAVILNWPLTAGECRLMTATNLSAPGWIPLSALRQIVGDQWQVTVPTTQAAQYFYLER